MILVLWDKTVNDSPLGGSIATFEANLLWDYLC